MIYNSNAQCYLPQLNNMMNFLLIFIVAFSRLEAFAESHSKVQYDQIFPLYVQSCALTRIKKIGRGPGAPWGHAVVYVKGMCRDQDAAYPRVKVCGDEVDLRDSNSGTLISVEPAFKNTNWVAIEGEKLAFNGDLLPGESVTFEVINRTRKAAVDSGAFRGIKVHKSWRKRMVSELTYEENIAQMSLGSHYAIALGRTSYCSLVPISQQQLKDIVFYLNQENQPYVEGIKKFKWDAFNNNCVHIARNVLAAAGVSPFRPVGRRYPLGIFDLLIPGRHFVALAKEGWQQKDLSVTHLFRDKMKRKRLEEFGMPSIFHGLITRIYEMKAENNEVFIPSRDLSIDILRSRRDVLDHVLSGDPMNNLDINLRQFEANYLELRNRITPLAELAAQRRRYTRPQFQVFYEKYKLWLDQAITEVREKIAILDRGLASSIEKSASSL